LIISKMAADGHLGMMALSRLTLASAGLSCSDKQSCSHMLLASRAPSFCAAWILGKRSASELQCQLQGMSPVIYASRMKLMHTFGGTFAVNTFLYYYVVDNRRYI